MLSLRCCGLGQGQSAVLTKIESDPEFVRNWERTTAFAFLFFVAAGTFATCYQGELTPPAIISFAGSVVVLAIYLFMALAIIVKHHLQTRNAIPVI